VSLAFRTSRRGLREIVTQAEKAQLAALLSTWGYVRPVQPGEAELGVWFAYGDDGLFWLIRDSAWQAADEAQLHLCAAPRARGRIASRWGLTAIEVVACLLGLRVLHAPVRDDWRLLLQRAGWTPEPRGPATAAGLGWMRRDLPSVPPLWTPAAVAMEGREIVESGAAAAGALVHPAAGG
jgi:hypothetical protein